MYMYVNVSKCMLILLLFFFSRSGDIKFWDLRKQDAIGLFNVGSGLRSMALHKDAELIAW